MSFNQPTWFVFTEINKTQTVIVSFISVPLNGLNIFTFAAFSVFCVYVCVSRWD